MSALKFTMSPAVKKVAAQNKSVLQSVQQLRADMREVNAAYDRVVAAGAELGQADTVLSYAQSALDNISKFGLTDQMLAVFNTEKALECLTGLEASAITKEAALEGLGQAVIDGVKKFLELLGKIVKAIRDFVTKILGTVGSKQREIIDNIDNLDWDKQIAVMSVQDFEEAIKGFFGVASACTSFIPSIKESSTKLLASIDEKAAEAFNAAPYLERIKTMCEATKGVMTFDETSSSVEIKPLGSLFKKQTLTEAKLRKGNINDLCKQWILPKFMLESSDAVYEMYSAFYKRLMSIPEAVTGDNNIVNTSVKNAKAFVTASQAVLRAILAYHRAMYFQVTQIYTCIKKGETAPAQETPAA